MARKRRAGATVGDPSDFVRFRIVQAILLLSILVVVGRLFQIQCLQRDFYVAKAEKMRTKKIMVRLRRGGILDQHGRPLATSVKSTSVFLVPEEVEDDEEATALLSFDLGIDRERLLRKAREESSFVWVKRQLMEDERETVEKRRLRGVGFKTEYKRVYPMERLASQVLGFVGVDSQGLEGMELQFDGVLGFDPRWEVLDRDGTGRTVGSVTRHLFAMPEVLDVQLTLDSTAQHIVEKELEIAVVENDAICGIGIVMEPRTGDILAMANVPGFDPNAFGEYSQEAWRNRAVTDLIAPGSTFKAMPAAVALDHNLVDEEDMFSCENGRFYYHGHWIRDVGRHEWLTFEDVLRHSSNVGMVKLASGMPGDVLYEGIKRFGFGEKTGVLLPGEVRGIVHAPSRWSLVSPGQIAIGQEIACTATQLATAYCALANDGLMMRPRIVRCLKDRKGEIIKEWPIESVRQVVEPSTATRVTRILTRVVDDGTGRAAAIEGFLVAGKTGTAQKVDPVTRAYSHEDFTCLFVGYFPAEDPRLMILLLLDEPRKDHLAGKIVAPVFARVGRQLAVLYGIEPTRPLGSIDIDEDQPEIETLPLQTNIVAVSDDIYREGTMPSVKGLTMLEVLDRIQGLPLDIRFHGSGVAVAQRPEPGTVLLDNYPCAVIFAR